jgi:hypothetical protein
MGKLIGGMMQTKNFNVRNLRWNKIEKTKECDANTFLISRPISHSQLKRGKPFVTAIYVQKNEIPKHILKLLN